MYFNFVPVMRFFKSTDEKTLNFINTQSIVQVKTFSINLRVIKIAV